MNRIINGLRRNCVPSGDPFFESRFDIELDGSETMQNPSAMTFDADPAPELSSYGI
ncbi:MAG: hypothetical protein LM550_00680 [Candidatus Contendobacter sp.]|jgi:hypothetical protein|nr:hypothetical protein [Gammaproteobacteria bacterium]MCC8992223.1 hypothetical protein [Candidatus Contendobacter sp.]